MLLPKIDKFWWKEYRKEILCLTIYSLSFFKQPNIPSSRGFSSFSRKNHVAKMPFLLEEDFGMGLPAISAKPFVPSYRPSGIESTIETGNEYENTFPAIDSETDTFYTMPSISSSGYNSSSTNGINHISIDMKKNGGSYGLCQTMIDNDHKKSSRFCANGDFFISPVKRSESSHPLRGSRSPSASPAPSLVSSEYSCSLSDSPFPLGPTTIPTTEHIAVQPPVNSYQRHNEVITPNYTEDYHQSQNSVIFYNTPALMGGSSSAFRSPSSIQTAEYQNVTPINEDDASIYCTPKFSRNIYDNFVDHETSTSRIEKDFHHSHVTLPQCGPDSKQASPPQTSSKNNTHTRTDTCHFPAPIKSISLCVPCDHSSSVPSAHPASSPTVSLNDNDRSFLAKALRAKDLSNPVSQCAPLCSQRSCMEEFDNSGSNPKFRSQSPCLNASPGISAPGSPPLPQNLKGDPHRQAKVKTELCLYFSRGSPCPFGARCNYAHGEEELKYTKLEELRQAGLIDDINAYRAHPCFSWVATGAW